MIFVSLILTNVLLLVSGKFYNESLKDFSKCKVHYSWSEATYKDFFEIETNPDEENLILDFHFAVMASSDAHILLSPSSNVRPLDPVYEIVLGAGGNTFCDIRRMQKSAVKASVMIKGLLSSLDVHSFWLHVHKDGLLEVGREGVNELAFISWRDPDPLPVKVFSFCSWPGVDAKWYFDCPREENITVSKEVEKILTDVEKLRRDMLTSYDPNARPVYDYKELTLVTMALDIHYISLSERKSTINIKGKAKLKWKDDKTQWNPQDYGGLSHLHVSKGEIWKPDIVLFSNADDSDHKRFLGESMATITNDGSVEWTPSVDMVAWCDLSDLGHWPSDSHSCSIIFGFWNDMDNLQLEFNSTGSDIMKNNYNGEWSVKELGIISTIGFEGSSENGTKGFDPAFLKLTFRLKRISNVYNAVFWTPYIAIAVMILSTFWIYPANSMRMYLCGFQVLIISIMIVALTEVLPAHPEKIPLIVLLYVFALGASFLCILFTIIFINIVRKDHDSEPPRLLKCIVNSSALQLLLLLPQTSAAQTRWDKIDSEENSLDRTNSIWISVVILFDRIIFILYVILFSVSLTFQY